MKGQLRELGFERAAALVERHHDWESGPLDETAVLYLADKLIREDERVGLEARFAASGSRCTTEEARTAHARRLRAARELKERINTACGYEVVV